MIVKDLKKSSVLDSTIIERKHRSMHVHILALFILFIRLIYYCFAIINPCLLSTQKITGPTLESGFGTTSSTETIFCLFTPNMCHG